MFPFCKKENKPEQVKCETCKHWVDKEDCQEVKIDHSARYHPRLKYYCPIHKNPYDKVVTCLEKNGTFRDYYFKTIPAYEVEVDEEGELIKKNVQKN